MAVKFDQHEDISAPPETVWHVMTTAESIGQWLPGTGALSGLAAIEPEATFQFNGGHGRISKVDAGNAIIQLVTQEGTGAPVTHTLDLDKETSWFGLGKAYSRVRYTMEYDPAGGFVGDFVAGGNPLDARKVKHALDQIKHLSETGG